MKKQEVVRKYSFSDAILKQTIDQIIRYAKRDSAKFSERGYDMYRLEDLEHLSEDFANVRTDDELVAIQMEATELKDHLRERLTEKVRLVLEIAGITYGKKAAKYRRFGDPELSRQSDPELVRTARVVHRSGTELLAELIDNGLTMNYLSELMAIIHAFDKAQDDKEIAVNDRDVATEERIEKGNKLYDELIKLAATGKSIWRTSHEAKYNDYVIYDQNSSSPMDITED